MSGHLRQRSPGSFELRYSIAGRVVTTTFRGGKRAAELELAKRVAAGVVSAPARLTYAAFAEEWFAGLGRLRPITRANYRSILNRYLLPAFGDTRLKDLSAPMILRAFTQWSDRGCAPSSLGQVKTVLASSLSYAMQMELLQFNPLDKLKRGGLPIGAAPEATPTPQAAIDAVLAENGPYAIAALICIATGCRRGEALGLRWGDISGDRLTIARALLPLPGGAGYAPTKTGRNREIVLPTFAVEALRLHRVACIEALFALGTKLTPAHPVTMWPDGSPASPHGFTEWAKARFGKVHGLRHAHASALLNAGVPLQSVSSRLGHASSTTTLRAYSHLMPGADERAAAAVEILFGSKPVAKSR